jgi:type VI secretion system protein VasD
MDSRHLSPVRTLATAVLLAAALAGCASAPKPPQINATVVANANTNPDARNRPSPVVVRVYELKAPAAFESADFFSLFEKDQATLAADMLAKDEFVLQPGQSRTIERPGKVETRYVAVMAGFRELERSVWRGVVPVTPGKKNTIRITLDDKKLTVQAAQ